MDSTFSAPSFLGAEVLSISAALVQNFSRTVSDQLYYNHPSITLDEIDYCNVTVTYTHPGQNDIVNVENWLPLHNWNGRLQAVGGGGFLAGRFELTNTEMAGAIGEGYAATTSDAGLPLNAYTPDEWAQISPGNPNLYLLENLAAKSLHDQVRVEARHGRERVAVVLTWQRPLLVSLWSRTFTGSHPRSPTGVGALRVAAKA